MIGVEIETRPGAVDFHELNSADPGLKYRTLDASGAALEGQRAATGQILVEPKSAKVDLVIVQGIERNSLLR